MIGSLKSWFGGRSPREQRLLIAMVALAALTILWAGIVLPVTDALSSAKERHAGAVVRLGETRARLAVLQDLQRDRPAALGGPLEVIVRARANDAGFPLTLANPIGGDRIQIAIASARPGALLGWIGDLERSGILVDSMNATDNSDQTVAVQMTLKARGI